MKLLEKLLHDELHLRAKRNLAKARSFRALLEETLQRYHNRLIDVAAVIQTMIEMRREWEREDRRAADLGLAEDELAFFDAVAVSGAGGVYDDTFLCELVHEVVQSIKRNLKVDWTEADEVIGGVAVLALTTLRLSSSPRRATLRGSVSRHERSGSTVERAQVPLRVLEKPAPRGESCLAARLMSNTSIEHRRMVGPDDLRRVLRSADRFERYRHLGARSGGRFRADPPRLRRAR